MNRGIIFGLAFATLSSAAMAQISVSAGTYLPSDATVKGIFGSSPFAWGFGLGSADRTHRAGAGFDVSGLSLSAPNNTFFTLGTTFGYEVQSGQGTKTMTYARVGTGIGYYNYSLNFGATSTSGNVFKSFSAAEVGAVLGKHVTLSAQYIVMPKVAGLDFSGLRLQAMYSFGG